MVPTELPVSRPVPVPIEATVALALLHAPLPPASVSVLVPPGHTVPLPAIAGGSGFTVNVAEAVQPDGSM